MGTLEIVLLVIIALLVIGAIVGFFFMGKVVGFWLLCGASVVGIVLGIIKRAP